jgi:dTDP-4-dehydrorhamnose reductase
MPHPTSVYGMEKYLGEFFIRANMDEGEYAILRTSWLYGMHNSKSFIHKCVKVFENASKNGTEMFGIDEEISIPTDVSYLSTLILNAMKMDKSGIFNAINSGEPMSRLEYMRFILSNLQEIGEFKELNPNDIKKLTYDDCPSLRRIGRVVLDSDDSLPLTVLSPTDCREQLRRFIRKNGLEIVNWARKDNGMVHGKAQR